jgi:hypothetical protein
MNREGVTIATVTCAKCDAPIQEGQQWCLQCGAAQPGSLGERPAWRPLAAVAVVSAALLAGAAVAAAAALDKHKTPPRVVVVAQAPAPGATTPPPATTPPTTTPAVPGTNGSSPGGTTSKTPPPSATPPASTTSPLFPPASSKPPKIPTPTTTPKSSGSTGTGSGGGSTTTPSETGSSKTNTTTTESKSTTGSSGKTTPEPPSPIVLDTDAASTYNPYHYPEAEFGDAALAIDGETSTAWTAKVNPSVAPRMAEGLLIDLKSPTQLGSLEVRTATPGMTVQIYGAAASKAPATITDPGWTPLSSSHVLKKDTQLKLHTAGHALRFLVVWVVKAPASSTGQAGAPGHVSLNEVVLFPPAA